MTKTKIDWCDMTWNPVTGCLHDCPYCYAKGIARRFEGHDTPPALLHIHKQQCAVNLHDITVPMPKIGKDGKCRNAPYPELMGDHFIQEYPF